MRMDVLLLAGGIVTPEDPLFDLCPEGRRSLIEIHGKPMVQWVIDGLVGSDSVGDIYIVGLTEENALQSEKPLHYLPDSGSLFDNIRSGVLQATGDHPQRTKVLLASADIPAVTPEMVDWLADQIAADPTGQVYYNVVTREVMEKRFAESNRSYVHLKDVAVCGGDLNAADVSLFTHEQPLWNALTEARKNPLKQVSLLGVGSLILIGLRLLTLDSAVKRVCQKLSIEGRALVCPYAEMAMDADKPHQLEILRRDLEARL